ncbi:MAG: acyl-CoA thioesterase [Candidatus Heimdallarchaeota archaeon]|nr:acyl-CoA thioesterase [Candidatus Heimdallarchaeota archaeon]
MNDSTSFVSKQIVRFSDTDAAGIVYFGAFATYFDEAFHAALRSSGIDWDSHRKDDFLLPIIEQNIRFYYPLRAHDEIEVIMTVSKIGNRSFTSSHQVYIQNEQDRQLCASGSISRVVVDYKNFEPKIIPSKLRKVLELHYFEE